MFIRYQHVQWRGAEKKENWEREGGKMKMEWGKVRKWGEDFFLVFVFVFCFLFFVFCFVLVFVFALFCFCFVVVGFACLFVCLFLFLSFCFLYSFIFFLFTFQNDWNLFWVNQKRNFLPGKSISHQEKNQEKLICPLRKLFLLRPWTCLLWKYTV